MTSKKVTSENPFTFLENETKKAKQGGSTEFQTNSPGTFMTSITTLAQSFQAMTATGKTASTPQLQACGNLPMLTMDDLRNMDFELFNGSTYFSWSPKAAFDARETGEVALARSTRRCMTT